MSRKKALKIALDALQWYADAAHWIIVVPEGHGKFRTLQANPDTPEGRSNAVCAEVVGLDQQVVLDLGDRAREALSLAAQESLKTLTSVKKAFEQ